MTLNNIVGDDDDETTSNDSDPSGTFIEFNEVEHPDAYQVISGGDDKRANGNPKSLRQKLGSDVHELFAPVAVLVADVIYKDETVAFMEWVEPDAEDIIGLIDSDASDVDGLPDLLSTVQPDAGDVVDLLASDEIETDFQDVYDEFKSRHTDDESENDE